MTQSQDRHIVGVINILEHCIQERPDGGLIPPKTVEALDVVYHALNFVQHPRGLDLWREALWQRRLSGETKQTLVRLLAYLTQAVAAGDTQAASKICNCLQVFVVPRSSAQIEMGAGGAASESSFFVAHPHTE